ncbi:MULTISPECIES: shikimate dehydrogenase [Virgibacillus]|uniref:Shikimate dehydrogenase (NADP(+)) n=2 Tax=Virgibacillus TaxID=84406 RepID=A0A024QAS0_9BACI|nr:MULTISPECIES: shikimate dehydrogenase [Virgibacillus]EQB35893.1 hypothetical protein M948_12700 [Virgibacillus sp. CM-4]GGJ48296.1 shikimate dehydrogenase (NADP(+)) [Virgibacillus kapii]CDQ39584.1 Shikimate dehydrogenase [Virgibacillus massiliensis]
MNYRFGLIGYPIQHSLSPWIHKRFMEKTRSNGSYEKVEILPTEPFEDKLIQLKKERLDGFNVTVPYKQAIIPFLDEIDPTAWTIGAVNTVVNIDGKWKGYNTDGIGYVRSLQSKYPEWFAKAKKRALILGAGGAARGIFVALKHAGFAKIDIANRTLQNADSIIEISPQNAAALTFSDAKEKLQEYDVLIQTTSVGMKPSIEQSIIDLKDLHSVIASDIVYQPIKTTFLQQAEDNGLSIHYGHTMLLYQAQYAFEIWTGIKPSVIGMDEELQRILEGR